MKYIRLTLWILAIILLQVEASLADTLMQTAAGKAVTMFLHVRMIIFIVGGFGLVGIAFQAIFGKVKWTWFAGLAVGLAILAAAGAIVNYATGDRMGEGSSVGQVKDTFTSSGEGSF